MNIVQFWHADVSCRLIEQRYAAMWVDLIESGEKHVVGQFSKGPETA